MTASLTAHCVDVVTQSLIADKVVVLQVQKSYKYLRNLQIFKP
jgi:hypothetical protein